MANAKSNAARKNGKRAPRKAVKQPHVNELYEASVQEPEAEFDFLAQVWKERVTRTPAGKGRALLSVREDFAATALNSAFWVNSGAKAKQQRTAIAVDFDPSMIRDGHARAARSVAAEHRQRLTLVESDVRDEKLLKLPKVDAVLALNFSYWVFHTRKEMLDYFTKVRRAVKPGGLFVLDFFGGSDAHREIQERRRYRRFGGYTYVWDQESYNPVTGAYVCKIHFELKKPRKKWIGDAFTYHWRLWGLAELLEILRDAGFEDVAVYSEKEDRAGEGTGFYRRVTKLPADRSYLCYLVGGVGGGR